MKTGDMMDIERQIHDGALTTTVAMLALMVCAALALWYFNPAPAVVSRITEITRGF